MHFIDAERGWLQRRASSPSDAPFLSKKSFATPSMMT